MFVVHFVRSSNAFRVNVISISEEFKTLVNENIVYDEIPKVMVIMAVQDNDKDDIVSVIMRTAKTSEKGAFGDGKIFISPLEEAYTVSTGAKEL